MQTPHRLKPMMLALATALCAIQSHANPTGGQVVSGNASIQSSGSQTTINQGSNRAIINWQGFSINRGESTRFNLPSSSSAVLNRVVGGNPSELLGSLSSNGKVFLINPNGVLVGNGATINTGAFFASTRDVNNQQFMNGGNLDFFGSANASVVNLGTINATSGDVVLLAHTVENQGSITAPAGAVALTSATELLYAPAANDRVVVKASALKDGGSVSNEGTIAAAQVELKAAGGNPYALAVNAGGSISAISLDNVGGRIVLNAKSGATQVSGSLTASQGDKGGEIVATGQHVKLTETAKLNANGQQSGGRIAVGGGYQGKDSSLQNAETTTVAKGAVLNADATDQGNGGQVTVWANDRTQYQGHASVRGGANGGDGGFIEVSGKKTLGYAGTVDMRATKGKNGTLLLDPTDITINDDAPSGSLAVAGNTSILTAADIHNALMMGNVIISTSSGGSGLGDITFAAVGNANAYLFDGIDNTLTLQAERDITVNQSVRVFNFFPLSTAAGLTLEAGRNLAVNGGSTYLWANNITLVADTSNGGNGTSTMQFANGVNLFGDNIRLFVPSADQLSLPGSVSVSSNPPVTGKYYGDAGTSAAGIYYKRAAAARPPGSNLNPDQDQAAGGVVIKIGNVTPLVQGGGVIWTGDSWNAVEQMIESSGNTTLIEWLKILKAAREKLAQDPSDETARKIAEKTEAEILKYLPDIDLAHAARLADAAKYQDRELAIWLNNVAMLEQYIARYGRDENTLASIRNLKQKIDLRLAKLELESFNQAAFGIFGVYPVGLPGKSLADLMFANYASALENWGSMSAASKNTLLDSAWVFESAFTSVKNRYQSAVEWRNTEVGKMDRSIADVDAQINKALEDYNKNIGGSKNLAASSWGTGIHDDFAERNLQRLYDQKETLLRERSSFLQSDRVAAIGRFEALQPDFSKYESSVLGRITSLLNALRRPGSPSA